MSTQDKNIFSVQNMVLIAIFTALIAVCSWIRIPIEPVPFTLQTFAVFVATGLLGAKRGVVSVIVYILLGVIGIPVFAGFTSGPSVIAGPTGGYIVGFIFTAIITGVIIESSKKLQTNMRIAIMVIAMIVGAVVYFAIGTIWFMVITKTGMLSTLSICVFPYLIPDLIKIAIATIIIDRVKKHAKIFD
ncbi:biotin transporter BioY [uncultured Eubacterium sp.]|uniref:biotin transporter BioY n=1 Tax=uncultured Eubacterium sp. TaxID=165185 RepID=UPI002671FC71|nr:biotin transporter BioY [uncultured Eubacterium sp.]